MTNSLPDNHTFRPGEQFAYAVFKAAAFCTALLAVSITSFAISWDSVYLNTNGDASWSVSLDSDEVVDYYQLQLARNKSGSWDYDYKTVKTSDDETSYDFSFSTKGAYYYIVRAKLIGGDYTDWSDASNTVYVTSDDIDDSPNVSSGTYYSGISGSYGPGTGNYVNSYTVINPFTGTYSTSSVSSGTLSTTTSVTSSGWVAVGDGDYMYRYSNGTYAVSAWDQIDGYWYYFDENGYMQKGWLYINGNWYYFLPSGRMAVSSWNNINEKWYYFNESGIMQTGYIVIDGNTYYTDSSGARVQSAYNPDGHLFDLNGVMVY